VGRSTTAPRTTTSRFYAAHTLFFLSATLFVPAVVGLARLVHPSHAKAAFWGCVLSLMGFVGYGALDGIDYMTWIAGKPDTGLNPAAMQAYIEEALHTRSWSRSCSPSRCYPSVSSCWLSASTEPASPRGGWLR
jgi:hypothetical protein